jgi:hypothetical protein
VVLTAVLTLWPATPAESQLAVGATLTVLSGTANVVRADGTAIGSATSGLDLGIGDQVDTQASSKALVTFFDGTEVELGADASLLLRDMAVNGSQTAITVESLAGSSVHRVATLLAPGSTYQVQSGGTVALVRGTVFNHDVLPNGDVVVDLKECGQRPGEPPTALCLEFPQPGQLMQIGESCMASPRGDVIIIQCVQQVQTTVRTTTTRTVRRSR